MFLPVGQENAKEGSPGDKALQGLNLLTLLVSANDRGLGVMRRDIYDVRSTSRKETVPGTVSLPQG
jgi:hypothetical protein